MAWSINAKGTKEECAAAVEAGVAPDDQANAQQYELARSVLKAELERYEPGSSEMNAAASGHVPGPGYSDRSLSIWISGRTAPRVEATPPPEPPTDPGEPVQPLTTRRRGH